MQLEVIRGWEKNPDNYSTGVTNAIFTIMERPYAPVNVRLRAAVEREKLIPQAFVEARKNLKNPPRIYTEIALQQIDDDISFFQNDVPQAFAAATDAQTKAEFAKTNAAVIDALKTYAAWMKSDLLPRSNGDFRYGADTFRKALAYNEMVDIPLDHLLQIGYDDLHKNQAEFARVAKEIDPTKTPQQELAELAAIHPAPDRSPQSVPSALRLGDRLHPLAQHHHASQRRAADARRDAAVHARDDAGVDGSARPVRDALDEGSTSTSRCRSRAGARRRPASTWRAFNVGTIVSTSVHEAYPGHYMQFLWQPQFPSTIRKLLGANTNIEGWAHYCEQMMLDEGYNAPGVGAKDEHESKLIRLGQLQDALLRDARFIVAIRMHTGVGGELTIPQAEDFFVNEGYQSRPIAEVETKRGTSDALYLYYTLGKLEILKLRADVQKRQGASFSLAAFSRRLHAPGLRADQGHPQSNVARRFACTLG